MHSKPISLLVYFFPHCLSQSLSDNTQMALLKRKLIYYCASLTLVLKLCKFRHFLHGKTMYILDCLYAIQCISVDLNAKSMCILHCSNMVN